MINTKRRDHYWSRLRFHLYQICTALHDYISFALLLVFSSIQAGGMLLTCELGSLSLQASENGLQMIATTIQNAELRKFKAPACVLGINYEIVVSVISRLRQEQALREWERIRLWLRLPTPARMARCSGCWFINVRNPASYRVSI